jgi:hypothetical protein
MCDLTNLWGENYTRGISLSILKLESYLKDFMNGSFENEKQYQRE